MFRNATFERKAAAGLVALLLIAAPTTGASEYSALAPLWITPEENSAHAALVSPLPPNVAPAWHIGDATALVFGAPAAARQGPPAPVEEIEAFDAAGGVGILVLPFGPPVRRTAVIIILPPALGSDRRSGRYVDQLLGADLAMLYLLVTEGIDLGGVVNTLAAHPRILGSHMGLMGFGAGARLVVEWPGQVRARALRWRILAGAGYSWS